MYEILIVKINGDTNYFIVNCDEVSDVSNFIKSETEQGTDIDEIIELVCSNFDANYPAINDLVL